MQAPPPYAPTRQKPKTGLIIGIVLGVLFVCCGLPSLLFVGAGIWAVDKGKGFIGCTLAFSTVKKAVVQYAEANGGKLPTAATWQDDVRPFYAKLRGSAKNTGPFDLMPVDGDWGCTEGQVATGMAFNATLSGKKLAEIKDRSSVMLFEVPTRRANQAMPYKKLDDAKSPALMGMEKTRRGWLTVELDDDEVRMGGKAKVNYNIGVGGTEK